MVHQYLSTYSLHEIDLSEKTELVKSSQELYVIYGSKYCAQCAEMKPMYTKLTRKKSLSNVYYVDLAEEAEGFEEEIDGEGVIDTPTIIHYADQKVANTLTGSKSEEEVRRFFTD